MRFKIGEKVIDQTGKEATVTVINEKAALPYYMQYTNFSDSFASGWYGGDEDFWAPFADFRVVEERVKDPSTGGEKGRKDLELGFLDPLAMEELGRVASTGSRKYAPFNYLKGYSWMLSVNAMFRHTMRFLAGEDRDPETGHLHTTHAAWHAMALSSFILRKRGTDDRAS